MKLPRFFLLLACVSQAFVISPSDLLAAKQEADSFDYGDLEKTPTELYDEAIKYLYGAEGYNKSRNAAIARLKKAASQDFAPALNLLGNLYIEGNGFFASPGKALKSFEQAAAMGDLIAQYNAGFSHLVGRGARASIAQAEKYFLLVVDDSTRRNISPEDFAAVRRAKAAAYFFLGIIYSDEDDANRLDQIKATRMFQAADDLNDPDAAMILAIRFAKGTGAAQDQAKSEAYLERYKIASLNQLHNSFSQVYFQGMDRKEVADTFSQMARSYEDKMSERVRSMQTNFGMTLLDDPKLFSPSQAFAWLEPVATEDNPGACARMARLYYRGEGVEQDLVKAREYLELAYKRSDLGEYNLAVMLAKGEGGPADLERAKALFLSSSKDSWYPAYHYLDNPTEAPFLTWNEATEFDKKHATASNPRALYCLGRRYLFGIGLERDYETAKRLVLAAAEAGDVQARYFYGVYIASDYSFFGPSAEDKAIQEAANDGYPPAIHHMGENFENRSQYKMALESYQRAAAMDHAPAICKLGIFYRDGKGVERNYDRALSYFRQAAETDYSIATLYLGMAYEYGQGVDVDPAEAYRLYLLAADQGSYFAPYKVGNLLSSGKLGEVAWEEAIPYWEKAADFRNVDAMLQLGVCYLEGKGVSKNLQLANNYFRGTARVSGYLSAEANYYICKLQLDPDSDEYNPQAALMDLRMFELTRTHPLAGYQLALMNLEGIGMKQNSKKAYTKLLKTAKLLGSDLRTALGSSFDSYYKNDPDLEETTDPESLIHIEAREAAIHACYLIAHLILDGEVKKTPPENAVAWLTAAANQSNASAQFELGQMYLSGKYVKANPATAWSWITKAAAQSDEAKIFAARSFFDGTYPEIGYDRAVTFLRSAARSGNSKAADILDQQGIPLNDSENLPASSPATPTREGEDDGIDGPVDLDVA